MDEIRAVFDAFFTSVEGEAWLDQLAAHVRDSGMTEAQYVAELADREARRMFGE